jgi:hypothetical protein
MKETSDISRFLENWQDEVDSAAEYSTLVAVETDPKIAQVYSNLAKMEEAHVSFWEERLRQAGASPGPRQPSWRGRVLTWLGRRFGPETVISTIAAKETADRNIYANQVETRGTRMHSQERWHALVLGKLVETQPRGLSGSFLGRLEGRHRQSEGTRCARRCWERMTGSARI